MRIDKANATTHQGFLFDHRQNLGMFALIDGWQAIKPPKDLLPVQHAAAGDLAENHRVHHHLSRIQHVFEVGLGTTQILDPN